MCMLASVSPKLCFQTVGSNSLHYSTELLSPEKAWSVDSEVDWSTHWKRPRCWERRKAGGEGGSRGWNGWMASPTPWTWIWANLGRWWQMGEPGVLQSVGSQGVGHDWAPGRQQQPCPSPCSTGSQLTQPWLGLVWITAVTSGGGAVFMHLPVEEHQRSGLPLGGWWLHYPGTVDQTLNPSWPCSPSFPGQRAQNPCHEPPMGGTALLGPPPPLPCSIISAEPCDFVSLRLALWHLGDVARASLSSDNILPLLLPEMYSFFQAQIRYFHPR